ELCARLVVPRHAVVEAVRVYSLEGLREGAELRRHVLVGGGVRPPREHGSDLTDGGVVEVGTDIDTGDIGADPRGDEADAHGMTHVILLLVSCSLPSRGGPLGRPRVAHRPAACVGPLVSSRAAEYQLTAGGGIEPTHPVGQQQQASCLMPLRVASATKSSQGSGRSSWQISRPGWWRFVPQMWSRCRRSRAR